MIIVAGTLRIPEDKVDDLMPLARHTLAASREEPGCIVYSYAFDAEDSGLMRIFEQWETREHLDAHQSQPHLRPWRAKLHEIGATERSLFTYETGSGQPL